MRLKAKLERCAAFSPQLHLYVFGGVKCREMRLRAQQALISSRRPFMKQRKYEALDAWGIMEAVSSMLSM